MPRFFSCFHGSSSPSPSRPNQVASANGLSDPPPLPSKPPKPASLSPVFVELFTSQGCSSCPPADLLISNLGQARGSDLADNVPVIVLAYHVEYWDYIGWKDPFASNLWSVRQRAYGEALRQDSIYTPEVVVQGRSHCIGSSAESISSLIKDAPRFPAPEIRASFSRPSPSVLEVSLSASLKFKLEGNVDVLVAMFENGQVTDCSKGENRGRVLTNDFVVKSLEKACTVQNQQAKKLMKGQVSFKLWESYSKAKCGMAVFFQNSSSMEVYGAQHLELPDDA